MFWSRNKKVNFKLQILIGGLHGLHLSCPLTLVFQRANYHGHSTAVDHILTESDNRDNNMADSKQFDTGSETSSEDVGVNLCGAVEIIDVKNLIREWICSTPGKAKFINSFVSPYTTIQASQ